MKQNKTKSNDNNNKQCNSQSGLQGRELVSQVLSVMEQVVRAASPNQLEFKMEILLSKTGSNGKKNSNQVLVWLKMWLGLRKKTYVYSEKNQFINNKIFKERSNIKRISKIHRDGKHIGSLDPVCCCVVFEFSNADKPKRVPKKFSQGLINKISLNTLRMPKL